MVVYELDGRPNAEFVPQDAPQCAPAMSVRGLAKQIVERLESRNRVVETRHLGSDREQRLFDQAPLQPEPPLPKVSVLGDEMLIASADRDQVHLLRAGAGQGENGFNGATGHSKDHLLTDQPFVVDGGQNPPVLQQGAAAVDVVTQSQYTHSPLSSFQSVRSRNGRCLPRSAVSWTGVARTVRLVRPAATKGKHPGSITNGCQSKVQPARARNALARRCEAFRPSRLGPPGSCRFTEASGNRGRGLHA